LKIKGFLTVLYPVFPRLKSNGDTLEGDSDEFWLRRPSQFGMTTPHSHGPNTGSKNAVESDKGGVRFSSLKLISPHF
jgi:hypothetical protein